MNRPTEQELKELLNALQLSINTKIDHTDPITYEGDGLIINFDPKEGHAADDKKLYDFLNLFGVWRDDLKNYVIRATDKIGWAKITLFLLLTRMDEENIRKLAELDETARDLAIKMNLKTQRLDLSNVGECSRMIFAKLEEKKMTIRTLAEKTGLTQASISNFKSGKDIRLSNFIKMVQALGLNVVIKK